MYIDRADVTKMMQNINRRSRDSQLKGTSVGVNFGRWLLCGDVR